MFYSINSEMNIDDEIKLLSLSNLNTEQLPSIESQIDLVEKNKKTKRLAWFC